MPGLKYCMRQPGRGSLVVSEQQQAMVGIHRVRDLLMKQHTMLINQLRGLMAEFGVVAAKGVPHVDELLAVLADRHD
jgi:transposase